MSHEQVVEMLIGMHAQLATVSGKLTASEGLQTEAALIVGLRAQTEALLQHFASVAQPVEEIEHPRVKRPVFGRAAPKNAVPPAPDGGATPTLRQEDSNAQA